MRCDRFGGRAPGRTSDGSPHCLANTGPTDAETLCELRFGPERLAWLEAGAAGGDEALIAAARAGRASELGTVAEARVGARRMLAVSRAPQHVERDLLLIEAEGLAPIGLVLVLVGVRLFERAGRRHRRAGRARAVEADSDAMASHMRICVPGGSDRSVVGAGAQTT